MTTGARVVLATNNAKKLVELRRVLDGSGIEVLGLADVVAYPEPAETEDTFAGNALLKARACVEATGIPALADDSGIAVDALNGMPGVRSARWSGPEATDASNVDLLLAQLHDLPADRRGATFVCAIAFALPDGSSHLQIGEMPGSVASRRSGANGFGYDPIFVPAGERRSTAELDSAEKDAISHRGQALRAMVPIVVETLGQRSPIAEGEGGRSVGVEGAGGHWLSDEVEGGRSVSVEGEGGRSVGVEVEGGRSVGVEGEGGRSVSVEGEGGRWLSDEGAGGRWLSDEGVEANTSSDQSRSSNDPQQHREHS